MIIHLTTYVNGTCVVQFPKGVLLSDLEWHIEDVLSEFPHSTVIYSEEKLGKTFAFGLSIKSLGLSNRVAVFHLSISKPVCVGFF